MRRARDGIRIRAWVVLGVLAGAPAALSSCAESALPTAETPVDSGAPVVAPPSDAGPPVQRDASRDASSSTSVDPATPGPYDVAELDQVVSTDAGTSLTIHVRYPASGPSPGPYPVVMLSPGFQVPATLYEGYVERLASHGIVGVTVDFDRPATNQLADAQNLVAALSWAIAAPAPLAGKVDAARAGVMGHSRGGKAAVLAAGLDARFKAVFGIDPVDAAPPFGCSPSSNCPDASNTMASLSIPSAFIGETLDRTPVFFQACSPAQHDYTTFYTPANTPSLEVTVNGASHMSFIDTETGCGTACSICQSATRPRAEVLDVTRAYVTAFFARHLGGVTAMDSFLTGAEAQARWVDTEIIALRSK